MNRWIGTSNKGYAQYAQEEIRRLFTEVTFVNIVPTEIFIMELAHPEEEVLSVIKKHKPVFLRHLQPIHDKLLYTSTSQFHAEELMKLHSITQWKHQRIAVHIRKHPAATFSLSNSELKEIIAQQLVDIQHCELVTQQADQIISIYINRETIYCGSATPEEHLSDWSGGAIRFKREDGQISRAKFKLLEAEQQFNCPLDQFKHALDIGAAPGGWSSLLLERGLRVTAVDPATLDPSIIHHPRMTFLQRNASQVSFAERSFDLLVCDMSWSPRQMTRLVKELLPALTQGGKAIITVKLMHKKPLKTIKELEAQFSPMLTMLQAKQLFHNRDELTIYFTKN